MSVETLGTGLMPIDPGNRVKQSPKEPSIRKKLPEMSYNSNCKSCLIFNSKP